MSKKLSGGCAIVIGVVIFIMLIGFFYVKGAYNSMVKLNCINQKFRVSLCE